MSKILDRIYTILIVVKGGKTVSLRQEKEEIIIEPKEARYKVSEKGLVSERVLINYLSKLEIMNFNLQIK